MRVFISNGASRRCFPRTCSSLWQRAFFELYAGLLKRVAVWPTIGNHEMGAASAPFMGGIPMGGVSTSSDPASYADADPETVDRGLPYLDTFTLPDHGEAGGVASGTELYYSFDYANVHVVSLDSQLNIRDTKLRETMKTWLKKDLAANRQDWTIVIFHHPPYTRSSHDSDEAKAVTLRIARGAPTPTSRYPSRSRTHSTRTISVSTSAPPSRAQSGTGTGAA
ncbi:MAG: metallophosphoesterase family protein [Candidatus Binatia bacterium]